jgi:hypothetical protein
MPPAGPAMFRKFWIFVAIVIALVALWTAFTLT